MPKNKSWFRMEKKNNSLAEIEIFDDIDPYWGIGPKEFKAHLDEIKDASSIKLLINSNGGSVFDGMAIYNLLKQYQDKLEVEVVGIAASIASVIALAGKTLTMATGSYYMIHNPWTIAGGNADALRKAADIMDSISGEMAGIYVEKTHKEKEEILKLMAEETWLTSDEAIEMGFADSSDDVGQVAARLTDYGFKNFKHIPSPLASNGAKSNSQISTARELEDFLRDAGGLSRSRAAEIVSHGWKASPQGEPEREKQGEPVIAKISPAMRIREIELNLKSKELV